MKKQIFLLKYVFFLLPLLAVNSCTKLDEKVYSRYVAENYYNTKNEVISAVLRPYTHANAWTTPGQNGWWRVSELSADQLAWPVKGIDGQDGGNWIRDHYHQWTNDDDAVWNPWNLMWWGLGLCNQPIENLDKRSLEQMGITQAEKDAYVAELKLVIPGVYEGFYKSTDLRKKEWFLIGPQFVYGTTTPVNGTTNREYAGQPLIFVDNVRKNKTLTAGQDPNSLPSNMTTGEENSGVRFNKYKLGLTTDAANYQATDWALYRLTWVYFAKAEAIMRKNNGVATQAAVDLINACKSRSFAAADWATERYTVATLTMDELLKERGHEFIFEGFRRQDLIRFDKFVSTAWWDHTPSNDKNEELLPIPNRQITLNPGLTQNTGY